MTREEAVKRLISTGRQDTSLIDTIEALGLIEFDEERKYIFFPHPDGLHHLNISVLQSDAVKTMRKYGYDVVKIVKEQS